MFSSTILPFWVKKADLDSTLVLLIQGDFSTLVIKIYQSGNIHFNIVSEADNERLIVRRVVKQTEKNNVQRQKETMNKTLISFSILRMFKKYKNWTKIEMNNEWNDFV